MKTWFALCASVLLVTTGAAYAQSGDAPAYHIETSPIRHIQAILTYTWETPGIMPRQWAMFAAFPPTLTGQDQIKAQFLVDDLQSVQGTAAELSPLHRPILWVKVPSPRHFSQTTITAHVVYEAVLYSRKLVPGAPLAPVSPLPPLELSLNLRSSTTIDWKASAFQHWLDANYLHRQPSERDLDFAFRIYQTIRSLYHYNYDPQQDRRASLICQTHQTDCGGLSYLLVTALRANGIPAHALAGRMAESATTPLSYGQCHVKSEFYAQGIGWVPVDMSYGVGSRDKDAQNNFGNDPGDLLVMHSDSDLELDPKPFGPIPVYVMQGISHWVWGTGRFDGSKDIVDWQVKDLPLATSKMTADLAVPSHNLGQIR